MTMPDLSRRFPAVRTSAQLDSASLHLAFRASHGRYTERDTFPPSAQALSSIPLRSISLSVRRTVDIKMELTASKLASAPFPYLSRLC